MTPLRFHPEADVEMMEAGVFYENQQLDLGKRFLAAVQHSLIAIQINPTLYPAIYNDVRRCITKIFPFNVDSRAPITECPNCRATNIARTFQLDGQLCPYCKAGSFAVDLDFHCIS